MRWKYPDERDVDEAVARRQVRQAITRWWAEFDKRKGDCDAFFRGKKKWDLPGWVNRHLNPIAPNLSWEFGAGGKGGHRLSITPEGRHHLRPLVEAILAEAPTIPGWEFIAYRPPEALEWALQSVTAKGGKDVAGALALAEAGEHHCVGLTFSCPAFAGADENENHRDAIWLTEGLLGEEWLNRWVGAIEAVSDRRTGTVGHPLDRLHETTGGMIEATLNSLPEAPVMEWREGPGWTQWQCRPQPAEDYPAQYDLIVASSMMPAMWACAHSRRHFWSGRFSRCGETFAYLKIEGSRRPEGGEANYRHEIDDAVNAALVEAKLGASVGGGTGIRYSYIDLALLDVQAALPLLREVAAKFDVPEQSWLLFHDDDFAAEWLGLFDDTPPPPGLPE